MSWPRSKVNFISLTATEIEDSFHTEGFFKRESSLYKQLVSTGMREYEIN